MKKIHTAILSLIIICFLTACVASQKDIFEASESQAGIRSIQSRVFDFRDRNRMLRTVIATLQDLGFIIDNADETLGTVSGTKLSGYVLRMTVSIRPKGANQMIVRSSVQYNFETVEDPEPYQQFFLALSKALFLETNVNSLSATPLGTESTPAATVVKDGSKSEKKEPRPESVYPKQTPQVYQVSNSWTGEWKVESTSTEGDGIWAFEQELHIVKSTKASLFNLRGKVKGINQLEGKLYTRAGPTYPFVLSMAADGQSFKGKLYGWQGKTSYLKGTKKNTKKVASRLNIFEPWTGRWKVTRGSRTGTWSLKQVGSKVVSTGNSPSEIKGLAAGDQLEGKIIRSDHTYPFTVKMSSDGLSFNGTTTDYFGRSIVRMKGEREE
jgi:hypothetical protein